jgi:hypothetical protein
MMSKPAKTIDVRSNDGPIALRDMFEPPQDALRQEIRGDTFARSCWDTAARVSVVLDQFPHGRGAACCFSRVAPGRTGAVRFVLDGVYGLESCPSGGWLLKPVDVDAPTYWIPRTPSFRRSDGQGRILSEEPAPLGAFQPSALDTTLEIATPGDAPLECVVWRIPSGAIEFVSGLETPLVVERQPIFMLSSHTALRNPADVYIYLLHGHVYENRFDQRRKRKICSELEAYSLYVALLGLENATQKRFYGLLKQQVLLSVIARQAQDGAWHHGEWTDFMESHYRFHNAAMLLLEAALEEAPSGAISEALSKAASVLSRSTDQTDIGVWFFHDSLEHSVELTEKSGIRWIPSRELGKSPATKMILNSHLDAIVTLDRYREVTGDGQYSDKVASALGAIRKLLALRPAEWLYRSLYWAVGLTLLPAKRAGELPLVLRALKRATRDHVIPQLHRVKRRYPRVVMPGGLVERHLSRLHFGVNYHSVNLMDLARLRRRFPSDDLDAVIDGAVKAVTETTLEQYWIEANQKQALGYWVEALYHLCTLRREPVYRRYVADAMLGALDAGLGLPPSLLGANPEVVKPSERFPCPSPRDPRLRVANLSSGARREILVVNPTPEAIDLAWEDDRLNDLVWASNAASSRPAGDLPLSVPARGWLLGHGR